MADFDNFESAPEDSQPTEEDPAAAFLAREQTELAGLEDDNFGGDSSVQQGQDGFDSFTGGDQETSTDFLGGSEQTDLLGNSLGDFEMVQSDSVPSMGEGLFSSDPAPSDGLLDAGSGDPFINGPSDAYAAISQVDAERVEPEKIRLWREEQKERLEKKDAEEENKKLEWREVAKKELEDWYKHHAEQLEKAKDNNRAAEEAFVKERDESVPGQQWEKICRLCEFNPKNMKLTKDVSRMRSMLLQLKQTPLVR